MSIDRQKGKIVFICDGDDCIESLDTEAADWMDAQQMFRDEGWRASFAAGWKHYCQSCAREIMGEG